MKEIDNIKAAIAAGPTPAWMLPWPLINACNPTAMAKVIAHIDAQAAEIERMRADAERWRTLSAMEAKRVAPVTLAHYIAHPGRLDYIASFEQLQIAHTAMKETP